MAVADKVSLTVSPGHPGTAEQGVAGAGLADSPRRLEGEHSRAVPPVVGGDIDRFERQLGAYERGELDEDAFRICRVTNGIYGQRQGAPNQMVRVKVPYGSLSPVQLEMLARVAETYSRGWGHITTRQNIQFHFVHLDDVVTVMRELGSVGLTTREAGGDTVRNVTGCHLAGACPYEVLDVSSWAEATFAHMLRHPYSQRLPRKFKINFSGCPLDCGQAVLNDVGVIATTRRQPDGQYQAGFRVLVAGGLGANPRPAILLEEFTPRELLLPTIEAVLRTFDHDGNRENKIRARMKWLVDTLGADVLRERILKERRYLLASVTWVEGIPAAVRARGDAPAGMSPELASIPVAIAPEKGVAPPPTRYERFVAVNVVRGVAKGTVSAYVSAPLGDVTAAQFRGLARLQRGLGVEFRVTNRQDLVVRGLVEAQLPELFQVLDALGMGEPAAELARDVVSCPGKDTCNLALTQSRGLAKDIGRALEEAGLADVSGVRINVSGCTNSCGQHHVADIGLFGVERRVDGRPAPGYQLLLGGHLGETGVVFAKKALRLPARRAAEAVVRVVRRFAGEGAPGECFADWLESVGGAPAVATELRDLVELPPPGEQTELFVDFDETVPFSADVGTGECAGA